MFTRKYTLTVKTRLQIKWSTITGEKLFRMSSCSHKWHNYDQNFLWNFLISLCITKRQYKCSKSRWKFSGNKKFFLDYQIILILKNVGTLSKLFFIALDFFCFDLDVMKYFWGHSSKVKNTLTYPQIICKMFWSD